MTWTIQFLEDVALADLAFEATGESLEEVFRGATQALLESMANPATVPGGWERLIERSDADQSTLLFDWLSEVVYWKDAAGVVFREALLTLAWEGETLLLRAKLIGAPVDRQSQELRNDVKGVTKHLYQLKEGVGQWRATVVLDV
ncbi:MAG: archease [Nitrospiraceae bacterium]